jgi:hypothetical protein
MRKFVRSISLFISGLLIGIMLWVKFPKTIVIDSIREVVKEEEIPQCDVGKCPIYESANVDGDDSNSESIVYIPYGMSRGIGQVWIIKDSKVIFKSLTGEDFRYKVNEEGNGITVEYRSSLKEDGISTDEKTYEKYVYKDGRYILESKWVKATY